MTHDEAMPLLDALLDDELDAAEAAAVREHLATCHLCAVARDARMTLREALRAEWPPLRAPEALRARIAAATPRSPARYRPRAWHGLAAAAALALAAGGGWWAGSRERAERGLAEQIFASHVRSLLPGHLRDVVSSDQHTVKPWFNGRLDFSPTVADFAGRGYPLLGGRLDYVGGRTVAALVYGRRQHVINVYLWPDDGAAVQGAPIERHGYRLLHWRGGGRSVWVASDLGMAELEEFAALLRQGESATAPL